MTAKTKHIGYEISKSRVKILLYILKAKTKTIRIWNTQLKGKKYVYIDWKLKQKKFRIWNTQLKNIEYFYIYWKLKETILAYETSKSGFLQVVT